jgi:hypothetical protein
VTVLPIPPRASFVQLVEFGLLKRMSDEGMEFVVVGSTAAYAYGLNVEPKDVDLVVEYGRDRWQRILALAELEDPQPGGEGRITREPRGFPTQLHLGLGRGVDVLSGLKHAAFSELQFRSIEGAVKVELLDDLLLPVRIASLGDLMESWRTRGRELDSQLIRAAEKLVRT